MSPPRRRSSADGLAVRRALSQRSLPALVAAMSFLAALALGAAVAARTLSDHWAGGVAAIVTIQVPDGDQPAAADPAISQHISRADAVQAALNQTPGLAAVHRLSASELAQLLRPWLGGDEHFALPLPAVFEVTLQSTANAPDLTALQQRAPGTLVERNTVWSQRLGALASSLQACAAIAIAVVAAIVTIVLTIVTRAGLHGQRRTIEIIHGLGATDSYIAGRFARRTGALALVGGVIGIVTALPLLSVLAHLATPFVAAPVNAVASAADASAWTADFAALPPRLLAALGGVPVAGAIIGWATAQMTVRAWLKRLP